MGMSNRRGYVRGSIRHRDKGQEAKLKAGGVEVIYVEGRGKETWAECVKSLRRGNEIVVTSLARVGSNRDELRTAIETVQAKGGVLVELETGRRSDDLSALPAMIFDAVDELAQDRRAYTSKEAKAAARKRWDAEDRAPRASVKEAEAAWRDTVNYPTNADALGAPAMAGWTLREAYRAFGPRWPNKPGGRPRKRKR